MPHVDITADTGYSSNVTVTSLLSDGDHVKAMIQNLTCIDHAGADGIIGSLKKRSAREQVQPDGVHPATIRKVLAIIPPLPESPASTDRYGYRYRLGHSTLLAAWRIIDADTRVRIHSKDAFALSA